MNLRFIDEIEKGQTFVNLVSKVFSKNKNYFIKLLLDCKIKTNAKVLASKLKA